ncbi:MAG: amidohydrolase family protein, partial [Phycisphaerales bacterium]|nr:amidohydrolase family protein [Phycisphaerales bacterium]
VVHDLSGEHVYPAFIDPFIEVETPRPDGDQPGRHWNENVTPGRSVLDGKGIEADKAKSRRELGFGAALVVPEGGVFAGSTAVVSLAEHPTDRSVERVEMYRNGGFQALDFETRGWSSRSYPTSTPGVVALMRQTLIDADWQAEWAPTLDGSNPANAISPLEDRATPLLFDCAHELEHFLAADIAGEFDRPVVLVGNGMEFKWLDGIADLGLDMVVPLRFPARPDVSSVGKAESVELETMMAWEQAPTNPRRLVEKMPDVNLALTASMLPKGRDFHDELRIAIKNGLSEDDALAMLTTGPAVIVGVADQIGTIEKGKRANLLVTSGPVFDKDSEFYDIWIDGVRHELGDRPGPGFDGDWRFYVGPEDEPVFEMTLEISGSPDKPKVVGTETWAAGLADGEQAEAHSSE